MFTLAGILADEEPKTAISPNGLYNSSNLNSLAGFQSDFSSTLLSEAEEFTLMFWFNLDSSLTGLFNIIPYREDLGGSSENRFIGIYEDRLVANIANSNFGTTYTEYLTTWNTSQWYHVAVTGSLINSRVRLYIDGLKVSEAIMNYSTRESFGSYLYKSLISIAQFNVYNRELTEAEVAEHYVDIDAQVGVLSYDAMTTAQRSGLIYSTSFIDNISYDGNEFKDKSTNNITLSTTPSLTGQQIYVYTDVSTSQIYAVNSFSPNGATQSARKTGYDMVGKFTNFSWSCWVKLQDTGNGQTILRASSATGGVADIALMYDWTALDPSLADKITIGWHSGATTWEYISTSNFTLGQWTHIAVCKNGTNWKLYINKVLELNHTATTTPTELSNGVFATEHNTFVEKLASPCSQYYMANQQLDQTDVDNLYNGGTPYCLDDLPTVTKNKMTNHWKLGTFNGSTEADAMLDQVGTDDFTNVGSTPFTGTGLSVECSEAPRFAVNSAELNGTSQYVVSTNASNYNFGTDTVFISGWVKSGEDHTLYFKGNETGTNNQDLYITASALVNGEVLFDLAVNSNNRRQWITTATPIPNDGNWHHVAIYHARTNDTTQPVLWVDSVSQGAIPQSYTAGSGWASANFTQTQPMKLGVVPIPAFYSVGTGNFVCTIKGYSPTQADIDELYNGSTSKCYADVESTLKARFMSFIDCGTYNGRTEAQALTEHVESELFTNVNSAPFTGTGLNVECSI